MTFTRESRSSSKDWIKTSQSVHLKHYCRESTDSSDHISISLFSLILKQSYRWQKMHTVMVSRSQRRKRERFISIPHWPITKVQYFIPSGWTGHLLVKVFHGCFKTDVVKITRYKLRGVSGEGLQPLHCLCNGAADRGGWALEWM